MEKTNYSVARVVTYTKQNIGKAERHIEEYKKEFKYKEKLNFPEYKKRRTDRNAR